MNLFYCFFIKMIFICYKIVYIVYLGVYKIVKILSFEKLKVCFF